MPVLFIAILFSWLCLSTFATTVISHTLIISILQLKAPKQYGWNSESASFNSYPLLTLIRSEFHLRWENTSD